MVSASKTRLMTARRWVLLVGTVVALVCALVAYNFVVAPGAQTAALEAQLATEVPKALAAQRLTSDRAHVGWSTSSAKTLGLAAEPAYSAIYDVCYSDHDDQGWFAASHNRKCGLHYVDFYALPKRNSAVEAAINQATSPTAPSPPTSAMVFLPDYLRAAKLPTRPTTSQPSPLWATLPGTTDAREATDWNMVTFPSVVLYARQDAFDGRKLLGETGSRTLNPHTQYLVISDARPYYSLKLGCSPSWTGFCESPLPDR